MPAPESLTARYVGCDPGSTGAIAALWGNRVTTWPVPLAVRPVGGSVIDDDATIALARELYACGFRVFVLEMTWGIRGQGGSSQYKFGDTAAALRVAFRAAGFEVHMVAAQRWKTKLRIHGDKSVSVAAARKLYPADADEFTPRRNVRTARDCEGTAEAALIAHYGQLMQL